MKYDDDSDIISYITAIKTRAEINRKPMKSAYISNKQAERIEKIKTKIKKRSDWMKINKYLAEFKDDSVAMYGINEILSRGNTSIAVKKKYLKRAVRYATSSGLEGLMWYFMLIQNGVNMLNKDKPGYKGGG